MGIALSKKQEEKRTELTDVPLRCENEKGTEAITEIAQELDQMVGEETALDEAVHIDEYTVPDARDWEPKSADEEEPEEIFAVLERDTDEFQTEEEEELFPVLDDAER
ncbi:hypothetical protein [Christensenella tenuis]|uniref:Uncharacterized protein n=1 Tax=Christensenella tenuis TaxID=2763033 RepID=A0ABR7EAU7_9FIRM|nr:hypothetical protein [Christensenella tenuis]MBC5646887.1 hypothetical protein [Christensenella tenuis]